MMLAVMIVEVAATAVPSLESALGGQNVLLALARLAAMAAVKMVEEGRVGEGSVEMAMVPKATAAARTSARVVAGC